MSFLHLPLALLLLFENFPRTIIATEGLISWSTVDKGRRLSTRFSRPRAALGSVGRIRRLLWGTVGIVRRSIRRRLRVKGRWRVKCGVGAGRGLRTGRVRSWWSAVVAALAPAEWRIVLRLRVWYRRHSRHCRHGLRRLVMLRKLARWCGMLLRSAPYAPIARHLLRRRCGCCCSSRRGHCFSGHGGVGENAVRLESSCRREER